MKDPVAQSSSSPRLIEFVSALVALIALGLTIIFSILKYDGLTGVSKWPWIMVLLPSLGVCFGCIVLWMQFHFFRAGKTVPFRWTVDVAKTVINNTQVDKIDIYHERYLFRDIMMIFCYIVTIVYASQIVMNPCSSLCKTPFSMFAVGVFVLNALRLILLLLRSYFDFFRLREICSEVRIFIAWRDERRLRNEFIPSVMHRSKYNIYAMLEGGLFCAMVVFIVLATIWVEEGHCMTTCNKGYTLTSHVLLTCYMIESVYMLSTLALVFFQRTCGLEQLETALHSIHNEQMLKEQYKKERLAVINDTDPF